MASRELMEARCGACHQEREPPATYWLARGRALMADRNCVACHEVPGHDAEEVRAPRLDGLAGKVSPAWLRGWLGDPREYLERSRMGNFRLVPDEVEALGAFLLEPHGSVELDEVDWTDADAERGGEIFRGSRCVTCHSVNGRGGTLAPELASVGAKVSRDWLYSWIRDPHRLQPDTLMPRFRFTDDEVRDLAAYIAEDLAEPRGLAPNEARPDPPSPPRGGGSTSGGGATRATTSRASRSARASDRSSRGPGSWSSTPLPSRSRGSRRLCPTTSSPR